MMMNPPSAPSRPILLMALFFSTCISMNAACPGCTNFLSGVSAGQISFGALIEASGLAASRRNYSVLWTHNDGPRNTIYAIDSSAALLASFAFADSVLDVEDVAVGPGPANGVSYLYIGDIGGSNLSGDVRPVVQLLRIPEPSVELGWAGSPRSFTFTGVNAFFLRYPDGSYDAETLMVDPLTADVWIATKQSISTRLYRINLNAATNGQTLNLQFVRTVPFSLPSAGDISPDGTLIVLRREDAARVWPRCNAEAIGVALGRPGIPVPLIGPPIEPNGEAIAFLADNTGYMTISEGANPTLYRFSATCPRAPEFFILPTNQIGDSRRHRPIPRGGRGNSGADLPMAIQWTGDPWASRRHAQCDERLSGQGRPVRRHCIESQRLRHGQCDPDHPAKAESAHH